MIGKTISHYEVLERLGRGGMGVVYKAMDTRLKRLVALKFLKQELTEQADSKGRFLQEARTASALDHQNICTIHEIDEAEDGSIFIVMNLCEGGTLRDRLGKGPLPVDEALDIAIQIAGGLERAHKEGLVHRDIKPANIMFTESGGLKIVDFGLAKLIGQARITEPGIAMGTAAYMSPEQSRGEDVSQSSDIWSLGVVFYEMLTGVLPFKGDYEPAIVYSILNEEAEPVCELRKEVSPSLGKIVDRCLKKSPRERYRKVSDLLGDLKREKSNLESGEAVTQILKTTRSRNVIRLLRILSAPLAVLIVIMLAILWAPGVWRSMEDWLGGAEIPTEKYLAVLPFTNVDRNPSNQAFCDGLVEIISSNLSAMEQFQDSLWVVPVREVVDRGVTSPGKARGAFGASLAVTGSIQKIGDSIRLTLNLIDTNSMRQLRSRVINKRLVDVALLQDELVNILAGMLELELQPQVRSILVAGSTDTSDAYDFYLKGRGYLQHYQKPENIEKAIELFKDSLKKDPDYALAHAGLGEAYYRKYESGRNVQWAERAIEECNRAVAIDENLAPVRNTLAIVSFATGKYEDSIEEFKRALALDPVNVEALKGMARAYRELSKLDLAEASYRRVIEIRPDYWAGYFELGTFYLITGGYQNAVAELAKALELTPDNTRAHNNLGTAYYNLGQYGKAREAFESSVQISPNRTAVNNLGVLYYREKRFADAARMIEMAMEWADRSDYRVWGNLASVYFLIPEAREKAVEHFKRAITLAEIQLSINTRDQEVISDLAGYYSMLGERAKAISFLQRVMENTEDIEVIFKVAVAYENVGDREKAFEWLEKALQSGLSPDRINDSHYLESLRADERFRNLLQRGGSQ